MPFSFCKPNLSTFLKCFLLNLLKGEFCLAWPQYSIILCIQVSSRYLKLFFLCGVHIAKYLWTLMQLWSEYRMPYEMQLFSKLTPHWGQKKKRDLLEWHPPLAWAYVLVDDLSTAPEVDELQNSTSRHNKFWNMVNANNNYWLDAASSIHVYPTAF